MSEQRRCATTTWHPAHDWAIETDEEGMRWFACPGRK